MVPVRTRDSRQDEAGHAVVLEPRYGGSALGRWLAGLTTRPFIEIRLDEFGSAVWDSCDGERPVAEIARRLEARFGERVAPVHDRLAEFLRTLERTRFIAFRSGSRRVH